MTLKAHSIGRANTVLVFGSGDSRAGVISAVVARRANLPGKRRLCFGGSGKFSRSVMSHVRRTILPVVDRILEGLRLEQRDFEISAVNLGAASSLDVGVNISGFSADTSLFLAMLSEGLQVPLGGDFVSTGHIASSEGDISAVQAMPAKVHCAETDDSIRLFLHPDLEKDKSMKVLSPKQRDRAIDAIMAARDSVRSKGVANISELIVEVFSEEAIVLASLREGFYELPATPNEISNPIENAVSFFTDNNETRFWKTLRWYFSSGDCDVGKELLQAFAQFHILRQLYPESFGARLFELICSLPPVVRRLKMNFPILNTSLCIKLSQFAHEPDYTDVLRLFDTAHGKNVRQETENRTVPEESTRESSDSDCIVFDTVASQINEQSLAQEVGIPIDSARSSFILDSSTIKTKEQFLDTLQAFYIHLQHHISPTIPQSLDVNKARAETTALLEKAFANQGGDRAAYAKAEDGIQGGMRSVLDAVTEEYKAEKQAAHIQRIFKDAVNVMDWNEQVRFVHGAMKRLEPFLPPDLRNQPPERFTGNYETIVKAYVKSFDKVNQLLRTF